MTDVRTRLVTLDDAEAIRAIYNREILESTRTMDLVARTVEDQRDWIRRHAGAYPAVVAVGPGKAAPVVGFASLSPWRDRPAYSGTVENSVYVHADHQGQGIGRVLLDEILRLAVEHGFHACMARIADGNEASIRLHASRGYTLVGVEREVGRKFGRWIDFTVMERLLQQPA